ncbi:MAG: ATP-binding cassette domain-containing protein [Rhodobacteraceae bacterium]|nr:ATP-binding cassette domain-containing protein [Paracoccaceae bacterium]
MLDLSHHIVNRAEVGNRNAPPLIRVENLSLFYGEKQALRDVNFDLFENEILAFIGPSGCGKSTALKCLNRMHDNTRGVRIEGRITMRGQDIYGSDIDPPLHRRKFGWVAQKPNPFPASIYENVAYGARIHGLMPNRKALDEHVETCLKRAHLWDEVKAVWKTRQGTQLSGGQQQRLCVARALATQPSVLLMDEPTGSIDPIATAKLEELMLDLRGDHSIVVITHSMSEAARLADRVAYFHLGRLLEIDSTEMVFTNARTKEAREFVEGRVG